MFFNRYWDIHMHLIQYVAVYRLKQACAMYRYDVQSSTQKLTGIEYSQLSLLQTSEKILTNNMGKNKRKTG